MSKVKSAPPLPVRTEIARFVQFSVRLVSLYFLPFVWFVLLINTRVRRIVIVSTVVVGAWTNETEIQKHTQAQICKFM